MLYAIGLQEHNGKLHCKCKSTERRYRENWAVRHCLQRHWSAPCGLLLERQQQIHSVQHSRQLEKIRVDCPGLHHAGGRPTHSGFTRCDQGRLQPWLGGETHLGHWDGVERARRHPRSHRDLHDRPCLGGVRGSCEEDCERDSRRCDKALEDFCKPKENRSMLKF